MLRRRRVSWHFIKSNLVRVYLFYNLGDLEVIIISILIKTNIVSTDIDLNVNVSLYFLLFLLI